MVKQDIKIKPSNKDAKTYIIHVIGLPLNTLNTDP